MYITTCITTSLRPSLARHYNFAARQQERDVFDTLFDSAPDKLNAVKGSLMAFANKQLSMVSSSSIHIYRHP